VFLLAGNAILIILLFSNSISAISNNDKFEPIKISHTQVNASDNLTSFAPSISPSPTPSPIPIPSPLPTTKPTPTPTINSEPKTNNPTITEKSESNIPTDTSGDVGLTLMKQINDFRSSKNLPPLSTDGYTCAFASLRAGEIISSFNHDGFRNRIDNGSLPYPSYSSVAENIAMNPDSNGVVPGWIASSGHNENMSKNVSFGCVARSGNYFVFEAWQP